jgi:hypothetical protein
MNTRYSTSDLLVICTELVEALYDTIEIALDTQCAGDDWDPHLAYLQQLARTTRAIAAYASEPRDADWR